MSIDAMEPQYADHSPDPSDPVEEKQAPQTYPCSGCAFSYTLVRANRKDTEPTVIRKHKSRTGPGLCEGAQQLPKVEPVDEALPVPVMDDPACCDECEGTDDDAAAEEAQELYSDALTKCQDVECRLNNGHAGDHARTMAGLAIGEASGHCLPGRCKGCCGCSPECTDLSCHDKREAAMAAVAVTLSVPAAVAQDYTPDPFTAPAPVSDIPDGSVSMQPEPERDRWGRYLIGGAPHTRVTTFVKAASSTYTLEQWASRMVIRGLVLRPDLMALAHGMDVKKDRAALNSIAEQAKETAGQKVAANLGSAYHAFTERLDAGLMTLAEVPEQYRARVAQYADKVRRAGLTTRVEWIERTTAVRADQVSAALPVAGTLDRIFQLPNGELVIGDLKTGSTLEYAWKEIESQLAAYAHGVNTHGLYDWNTRTWQPLRHLDGVPGSVKVRTDWGLVVHLPADGDGCTLYKVDLERGWRRAQVCGQVMADQKVKAVGTEITVPDLPEVEAPAREIFTRAVSLFTTAESRDELLRLARQAHDSQAFTAEEMAALESLAGVRWEQVA